MQDILAFIIVLIILLILCGIAARPFWKSGARQAYTVLVKHFGRPTYIQSAPGGYAVWKRFKKESPFVRLMIVDEDIKHKSHNDYVYGTIKYSVDNRRLPDVLNISDAIMYDRLKEELTVRCSTLESVVALLVLADKVHNNIDIANEMTYEKSLSLSKSSSADNYRILQSIKENYNRKDIDYSKLSSD